MKKLTIEQSTNLLTEAKKEASKSNTRLGQCIMNLLPKDIYDAITGTDDDFFYWEDEGKVLITFLNVCVLG